MPAPARSCDHCGYDLAGLREPRCPECGKDPDPARARRAARRRWATSAAAMAVALYAPYAWLLLIDYPWSDYRWAWIRSWPALPLMLPAMLTSKLTGLEPDSTAAVIAFSLLGLALLWGLAWLGRRGRLTLLATAAAVLALSSLNSFGLYHVFRA